MKVKELIQKLQHYDPEAEVMLDLVDEFTTKSWKEPATNIYGNSSQVYIVGL